MRSRYRIESAAVREAKAELARQIHTVVVAHVTDVRVRVPREIYHWAYDLRRGQLSVYGTLLRFLELLRHLGAPKSVAVFLIGLLLQFVDVLWSDDAHETAVVLPFTPRAGAGGGGSQSTEQAA